MLKSKISLLQSLREFIHVYPGEEDSLFIHISEMGFDHITAGMDINIQNLNIELVQTSSTSFGGIERVIYEKVGYIKKKNSNASQNVRNRKDYARSLFDAFA